MAKFRSYSMTLLFASSISLALNAQSAPVVRSGSYEVGGFIGFSFGTGTLRSMAGGNVTYALTKRILPYFEYTRFPAATSERRTQFRSIPGFRQPLNIIYRIPIDDIHAGVHYRLPIRESNIVPYLVAGAGVIRAPQRDFSVTLEGIPFGYTSPRSVDFAVNAGAGLRYYVSQRFGFRLEAKAYKPAGQFPEPFGKIEAGFFLQLR